MKLRLYQRTAVVAPVNLNELPTRRRYAIAIGASSYWNGKPCKRGHLSPRSTANTRCLECGRLEAREWNNENRAKRRLASLKWNAANKEKCREIWLAWDNVNRDRRRSITRNYRARKRSASGNHTPADIADILRFQRKRCAMPTCRARLARGYHVDHIQPLSKGGSNDRRNLQALCSTCNLRKHAKDPIAFAQELGMLL